MRGSDKGTVVIPNGVEPRPHLDLPRQRGGDAETLVFLGHPKPWHGAERLVPLLSELRLAGRDTRLLVIGGGQGAEDIAQAVSRFGVAESVEITGPLSHARATRELLRGTVLVAPYPRHEPFYFCPLKVLEGMAAGLPVVVSDQGDIAALVGDAGVLVDPDDDDALRGEVLALLEAPDRRHELGRLGRERALAHFTWRAAAARLTEAVALEPKRWRSEPIRGGAAVVSNLTSQLPASLDVGDLSSLLDEDLLLELLSDSGISAHCVSPRYIRLKPNVGALVAIELEADSREGERVTHQGYVRTHPGSRAAALAQKWAAKRAAPSPLGDGVRLLATKQSVLFLFPNDANLRDLGQITDFSRLKRALRALPELRLDGYRVRERRSRLEVVRYKPERRLVMRAMLSLKNELDGRRDERSAFLCFFPDATGQRIDRRLKWLDQQPVGLHVPDSLGALAGGQIAVERAVGGSPALSELLYGQLEPEAVAELLLLLHASSDPRRSTCRRRNRSRRRWKPHRYWQHSGSMP